MSSCHMNFQNTFGFSSIRTKLAWKRPFSRMDSDVLPKVAWIWKVLVANLASISSYLKTNYSNLFIRAFIYISKYDLDAEFECAFSEHLFEWLSMSIGCTEKAFLLCELSCV